MVLRSSISNTRKFFQKTINNFKSFFSNNGTYQKLPKTPNNNHHHHHPNSSVITSSSSTNKEFQPKHKDYVTTTRTLTLQTRREERSDETLFSKPKVDLVRRKLKEMETMMNNGIISDEHYISDVREFLHCYSCLRYTAYLNVVEQFFMEVYSDFFSPHSLEYTRAAVRARHSMVVGVGSYGGNKY